MFAGPNGSGKSTIKSVVPPELLGVYVNPDEMQKDIELRRFLTKLGPNSDIASRAPMSRFVGGLGEAALPVKPATPHSPTATALAAA